MNLFEWYKEYAMLIFSLFLIGWSVWRFCNYIKIKKQEIKMKLLIKPAVRFDEINRIYEEAWGQTTSLVDLKL